MSITRSRLIGIYFVIASAVLWSTAGLVVRIADVDLWTMIGWRSIFSFATLGAFVLVRRRLMKTSVETDFGLAGVAACAVSTVASITYVASLQWTTVANVMTVYATLPFVATGIAFLWLRDRVTYRFIIAGCLAFLGVAISVGVAVSTKDLLGIFAAFVMTVACAMQIVIAKRFARMDMTMMTAFAALACFCIALPFMQHSIPTSTQLLACAFYGVFTTGIGYVLLLLGSRRIGSGEAGLLSMLDVILGPLWVWIFIGEDIPLPVLLGGAVVLFSVFWYLLPGRRAAAPA